MASTKHNCDASTSREPFGPVTELIQVPLALFEIQALATEAGNSKILEMVKGVIATTLPDPDAWQKIGEARPNGK
jgi:hypothetical protein